MSWRGDRLWYAVSINLVHNHVASSDPIINPDIIHSPPNPWLQVKDMNGNVISDRVAAVIIAPGEALGGQNRAGVATVENFLDSFQKGGTVYSNQDYTSADEDFFIADDSMRVDDGDLTITRPYLFNDKLVYITIDELMAALEKRVGEEVRRSLKAYKDINGYYPYAAHLGTSLSFDTDGDLEKGFLPLFQKCDLDLTNQAFNCRQPIFDTVLSGITNIKFAISNSLFYSATGNCTQSGDECNCNGTGSCTASSFTFECDNEKCWLTGTLGVSAMLEVHGGNLVEDGGSCSIEDDISTDASGCPINTSAEAKCDLTGDGNVAAYANSNAQLNVPDWFIENQWQKFVYYDWSSGVTSGGENVNAIVITTGSEINASPFVVSKNASQTRPSCNALNDYLDSTENADYDSSYDPTFKQRTINYNDQIFVVEP
jgi:hypothetical protein